MFVCQLYWWREPKDPEKTIDLSHITDKLYHILLYTSPWSRFELTTSVMIGTDCKSSCKSNYHMITATTVLNVICNTSSVICLNLYFDIFRHYVVHCRCDCWWHLMASRISVLTASSFYKYTHNPCKWTLYNSFYSTYISICGDFIVLKLCCSLNGLHHCTSYKTYHRGCN